MEHTKEYNELVTLIENKFGYQPYTYDEFRQIIACLTGYCSYGYQENKSEYMYAFYEYIDILQWQLVYHK